MVYCVKIGRVLLFLSYGCNKLGNCEKIVVKYGKFNFILKNW